jgi:CheY-like chemotaxis protein
VLLAGDGKKAVKVFRQNADEIALVILDLILPGMDGADVYKHLKTIDTNSKIILTSGYINNSPFQEIIDRGEDTFIPKPWDLPHLINETRRVLGEG